MYMKLRDLYEEGNKDLFVSSVASARNSVYFALKNMKRDQKISDDHLKAIKKQWNAKLEQFYDAYRDRSFQDTERAYDELRKLEHELKEIFPEYWKPHMGDFSE